MVGSIKSLENTNGSETIQRWLYSPFPVAKEARVQPEVMIGQRFQHGDGHPLPDHQQQRDSHVVVALVVVELRVAFQNLQDDVDELLLKDASVGRRHS